jgi:hypothetical protein
VGMKCRNNCDFDIHFDPKVVSKNGKSIPLEEDGRPHNCPMNPYRKKQHHEYLGVMFDELNGFLKFGNFILPKGDFCKCGIYKGLLTTNTGGMVLATKQY